MDGVDVEHDMLGFNASLGLQNRTKPEEEEEEEGGEGWLQQIVADNPCIRLLLICS